MSAALLLWVLASTVGACLAGEVCAVWTDTAYAALVCRPSVLL